MKYQVQKRYTNQILFLEKRRKIIYYIPVYLRIKIKNFTQLNLQSLSAQMNATLVCSIYYGNLQEDIVNQISKNMILHFNRDDSLKLDYQNVLEINLKKKQIDKTLNFTIRRIFKMRIESDVFWTPFQIVNLYFSVTMHSIVFKKINSQVQIKFNLMDHPNSFLKMSYTEDGSFGIYDLAEALMSAEYTKQQTPKNFRKDSQIKEQIIKSIKTKNIVSFAFSILEAKNKVNQIINKYEQTEAESLLKKQKIQERQPNHFQYAHFKIPLYRFPATAIVTIFLPLWLLSIINLGVFFQGPTLEGRLGSIAALMIAFIELISIIRQQKPPHPVITFIEFLVYLQIVPAFLCFLQSLSIRNRQSFHLNWITDGYFLVSLLILIFTISSIMILFFLHKTVWQPTYNRFLKNQTQTKFIHQQWLNRQCDQQFNLYKNSLKILGNPRRTQYYGKRFTLKNLESKQQRLIKNQMKNQKIKSKFFIRFFLKIIQMIKPRQKIKSKMIYQ